MNIITKMSTTELKALAYDQLVITEQAQKNIQAINSELAKRAAEPVTETSKEVLNQNGPDSK